MGMLEGDVEVRQDAALGHQRDEVAHMRIGVDVMQADPCPEVAQVTGEVGDMGAVAAGFGVLGIDPVGGGVLADDEQFLHPVLDQLLGFAQHRMGRARREAAAHVGDDAELALVITTL